MFSCRKQKLKADFVSNKQNLYFPLPSGLGWQSLRLIPGSLPWGYPWTGILFTYCLTFLGCSCCHHGRDWQDGSVPQPQCSQRKEGRGVEGAQLLAHIWQPVHPCKASPGCNGDEEMLFLSWVVMYLVKEKSLIKKTMNIRRGLLISTSISFQLSSLVSKWTRRKGMCMWNISWNVLEELWTNTFIIEIVKIYG